MSVIKQIYNAERSRQQHPSTMKWVPVDSTDMDAFIGVNIAQGLDRRSHIRDYWSTKPWSRTPWYGEIFPVNDFCQIHRYLHCCDNLADHADDKLYKVRYLISKLQDNFRLAYTPGQNISVDEQMIGTKCRVSFIQYMPKKPTKFGIKVWVLADSSNGYCSRFEIYTGKVEGGVDVGLPTRVVHNLSVDFRYQGYHLYFDNFYTSPSLCQQLLENGILSCGTVRVNRRGLPEDIKPAPRDGFRRGDILFRKCGSLTAVRWKDKRDVTAISTLHGNDVTIIPARRDEQKSVRKPKMIVDYNSHMGGVDLLDQLLCYYTVGRRTLKWWKRVFWRLVELCITNALVLYKENSGRSIEQKTFREELIMQLTEPQRNRRIHRCVPVNNVLQENRMRTSLRGQVRVATARTTGIHHHTTTKDGGIRRTCRVCGYQRKADGKKSQKKTNNFCITCKAYLHRSNCWNLWHSKAFQSTSSFNLTLPEL